MAIKFVRGQDITTARQTILVCPIHLGGVLRRGLADHFAGRFPDFHSGYRRDWENGVYAIGIVKSYSDRRLLPGQGIVSLPTRAKPQHSHSFPWIEAGLNSLLHWLNAQPIIHTVAIPPLGCGNGQLKWKEVRALIISKLGNARNEIVVYEP